MIEYIKGEITDLTPTYCVLETNGIGYMLNISLVTYQELQGQTAVRLYVYENIREDAHVLYGFLTKAERELFLLLISVSGVGAATGLAGTITSGVANTDATREDADKSKSLNTASNVLAGVTTAASLTATVFNATQIAAAKRIIEVAEQCEEALK